MNQIVRREEPGQKVHGIDIDLNVDTTALDQALEKAERLKELLDELKSRLVELSEMPTVGMVYVGTIDKGVTGVDRTVKVEWPVQPIRENQVDAGGACGSRAE